MFSEVRAFALGLAAMAFLSGCFSDDDIPFEGADGTDDADTSADADGLPCVGERACLPLTPSGWDGPAALWRGPADAAPECPDSFPLMWAETGTALSAAPVDCACSCKTAEAVDCGDLSLSMFPNPDCSGLATATAAIVAGTCNALGSVSGSGARVVADPSTTGDLQCQGTTTELSRATPTWNEVTMLCGGTSDLGGCAEDQQCTARADAPMQRGTCIFKPGEHVCPDGPWTERSVVFESWNDERRCSACSCGEPDMSACAPNIELFTDADCATPHPKVPELGAMCGAMQGYAPHSARATAVGSKQLTCEATGGDATGDVTPAAPLTVCCAP